MEYNGGPTARYQHQYSSSDPRNGYYPFTSGGYPAYTNGYTSPNPNPSHGYAYGPSYYPTDPSARPRESGWMASRKSYQQPMTEVIIDPYRSNRNIFDDYDEGGRGGGVVSEKASRRRRSREPVGLLPASRGEHAGSRTRYDDEDEYDINPYEEHGSSALRGAMSWFKGLVKRPQQRVLGNSSGSGDRHHNDKYYSQGDKYPDPSYGNGYVSHKSREEEERRRRANRRSSVPEGDPYADRRNGYADPSHDSQSRHHRHRSDGLVYGGGAGRPEEYRPRRGYEEEGQQRESRRDRRSMPMGDERIERGRTLSRERANSRFKNHERHREHDSRRREIPQGDGGMYSIQHSEPLANLGFDQPRPVPGPMGVPTPAATPRPIQTPHPPVQSFQSPDDIPPASLPIVSEPEPLQNPTVFGSPPTTTIDGPLTASPQPIAGADLAIQMGAMTLEDRAGGVGVGGDGRRTPKASSPTSYSEAVVYHYDPDVPPVVRRPRGDSIRSILKPPSSASSFLNLPGDSERVAMFASPPPPASQTPSPPHPPPHPPVRLRDEGPIHPQQRRRRGEDEEPRRRRDERERERYPNGYRSSDEPGVVALEYPDGSRHRRRGAHTPPKVYYQDGRPLQRHGSGSGSVEYHYDDRHRAPVQYRPSPYAREQYSNQDYGRGYHYPADQYRDPYGDGRRYATEQPPPPVYYPSRDPYGGDAGYGSSRRKGNIMDYVGNGGQYYRY